MRSFYNMKKILLMVGFEPGTSQFQLQKLKKLESDRI